MNRRNFFKALVAAPLLALLPKRAKGQNVTIGDSVDYTSWTATEDDCVFVPIEDINKSQMPVGTSIYPLWQVSPERGVVALYYRKSEIGRAGIANAHDLDI